MIFVLAVYPSTSYLDPSSFDPIDREYVVGASISVFRREPTFPSFESVRTTCKPLPPTVKKASMMPRGRRACGQKGQVVDGLRAHLPWDGHDAAIKVVTIKGSGERRRAHP